MRKPNHKEQSLRRRRSSKLTQYLQKRELVRLLVLKKLLNTYTNTAKEEQANLKDIKGRRAKARREIRKKTNLNPRRIRRSLNQTLIKRSLIQTIRSPNQNLNQQVNQKIYLPWW